MQNSSEIEESMLRVLISYSKSAYSKGQVSVTFKNIRDFQFSKYMKFLALNFREYTYFLEFSGNTRNP